MPHRWVALLVLVCAAAPAAAHEPEPKQVRELLRVQGYKSPAPSGTTVVRELTFVVLGQPLRFAASDWRTFSFAEPSAKPTPAEAAQIALQGDRPLLRRITTARPDQQITVLAERHPGSSDAFVVSVDLCPP